MVRFDIRGRNAFAPGKETSSLSVLGIPLPNANELLDQVIQNAREWSQSSTSGSSVSSKRVFGSSSSKLFPSSALNINYTETE